MGARSLSDVVSDYFLKRWPNVRGYSLRKMFIVALVVMYVVSLCVFLAFDINSQRQQSEAALLEEARVFSREMDAVWEFVDNSQYLINYTSDGIYEFKGLYCSLVGKSVGKLFSANNDYKIRYTNFNPRNVLDTPDAFEEEALTAFTSGPVCESYGVAEYDGEEVFRYVGALEVKDSCLGCHGEPVGELDVTGHAKEGWTYDSVGGAISIVMPLDQQREAMRNSVLRDSAFFSLQTVVLGLVLYFLVQLFVFKPLERVSEGYSRMRDGSMDGPIDDAGTAREIAEHIGNFNEMAVELRESYEGLETQVEERTRDLREANVRLAVQKEELEELSERLSDEVRYKSDMLSMVNHELRTPLTSIITVSQTSLDLYDPATERERRAWESVQRNGAVLLGIINNMLDLARQEAGSTVTQCDPVDIGDIVAAVRTSTGPIASGCSVSLRSSVAPDVPLILGDYEKMQRMLENLVGNAVKFTPDGGVVSVCAVRDAASGDVIIHVSDTGIGIAPEDQERIFERFVQVDSTSTRSFAGSGLGLALVKGYAEAQGFEVSVESSLGEGSTFTVRVPFELTVE